MYHTLLACDERVALPNNAGDLTILALREPVIMVHHDPIYRSKIICSVTSQASVIPAPEQSQLDYA